MEVSLHNMRGLVALALLLPTAGCDTASSNVALKGLEGARRDQQACLQTNAGYFTGQADDPHDVARNVAAACRDKTNAVATYAVPHVTPSERARFQAEAEQRAAGYVSRARGES